MFTNAPIGIMGAMEEEISSLKSMMENPIVKIRGKREYVSGMLFGKNVVLVFSRWGKVASASTVTTLIVEYNVGCVIFTGVAGALCKSLNIGDIVIGTGLYQHDMNAAPLFPKREIPYLGLKFFQGDKNLLAHVKNAAESFFDENLIKNITSEMLEKFFIKNPRVHLGLIASGDQFISKTHKMKEIIDEVPGTLAVEMEGAAVAQVCFEHQIPVAVIRTISDRADHAAPIDFSKFVKEIATHYSQGIIEKLFNPKNGS